MANAPLALGARANIIIKNPPAVGDFFVTFVTIVDTMKHFMFGTFLFTLGAILVYAVIRVVGGKEIIDTFFSFTPWGIIPILILTVANMVVAVWRWQLILRTQGVKLSFRQLSPIYLAGYAFSYITPIVYMGGEGVQAYMLKERHKVDWHVGLSSIVLEKLVNGVVVIIFIIMSVGLFIFFAGLPELTKTILGAIAGFTLLISAMTFVLFRVFRNESIFRPVLKIFSIEKSRAGRFLYKFEKELQLFLNIRSKSMWGAFFWTFIKHLLTWGRNLLIIFFLGQGFQFAGSFIALGAAYIAYALPIPGALGVQEIFQSLLFSQFGFGAEIGTVFSLIFRGAELFVVGAGAFILLRVLTSFFAWRIMHSFKYVDSNNNIKK